MKTIEQVRAEAKAMIEAKIAAAKEQAEISLLTNEAYQEAQVNQALRDMATDGLNSLIDQCKQIVESNPVYSKQLKQNRTFNLSSRFGLGNQITLLSGLLSGIQYSVQEHSQLMHAITGLSPDLIEATLMHLGSLPYYSDNYNEVIEGTPGNAEELRKCILLIEGILGFTIDKTLINQSVMDRQYYVAKVKAEKAQAEAALALDMQNFIIK